MLDFLTTRSIMLKIIPSTAEATGSQTTVTQITGIQTTGTQTTGSRITVTQAVQNHLQTLPAGQAFTPKSLLHLGSRAAIDQVLSRMCRSGTITRMARGVYAAPAQGEWGAILPNLLEVVEAQAQSQGVTLVPHGAVALNYFGLSTQNPLHLVLYTSGRSRETKIGHQQVRFEHFNAKNLLEPNTPTGLAITALRYLGPQISVEQVRRIYGQLSVPERQRLEQLVPSLPGWMIETLREAQVIGVHAGSSVPGSPVNDRFKAPQMAGGTTNGPRRA
jgi:hypothetical protein